MLDGDDGDKTVSHVLSIEVVVLVLEIVELSRVVVEHACERRLETGHKRAAVHKVDAVAVRVDLFGIIVDILECDLHLDITLGTGDVHGLGMERRRVAVDVGDEALDAIFLIIGASLAAGLFVGKCDRESAV